MSYSEMVRYACDADEAIVAELAKAGISAPADRNTLRDWIRAAREVRPVVVVGAGLSVNAVGNDPKPALWWQLAEALRTKLAFDGSDADDAKESDALWLAQLYEERFGRQSLLALLRHKIATDHLAPGPPHDALVAVDWASVVTTNYDDLIERAIERAYRLGTCVSISDDHALASAGGRNRVEVIHPHGSFAQSDKLVVTLEDYRALPLKQPGILAKLRQLFLQHPIILVGYGLSDPTFVKLAGWVRDVAGEATRPWVSLHVSPRPVSFARSAYWRGLRIVHIPASADPGGTIAATLRVIRDATTPVSPYELGGALRADLRQGELSPADVMSRLNAVFEDPAQEPWSWPHLARSLLEAAFRRILYAQLPGDADQIWDQLNRVRGHVDPETGEERKYDPDLDLVATLKRGLGELAERWFEMYIFASAQGSRNSKRTLLRSSRLFALARGRAPWICQTAFPPLPSSSDGAPGTSWSKASINWQLPSTYARSSHRWRSGSIQSWRTLRYSARSH